MTSRYSIIKERGKRYEHRERNKQQNAKKRGRFFDVAPEDENAVDFIKDSLF